ncbi:hypothetical protein EVG20_g6307 [Dentipellis fragilis]|uniref:BTB domain-containing protein n=1 Tax=Dentipellis fragilis TaxID=205917 RepID=A0A4Y9YLT2_9AGAM|nr:hypothetical protein EVG20_g6307 [Dentipellis fragilis]
MRSRKVDIFCAWIIWVENAQFTFTQGFEFVTDRRTSPPRHLSSSTMSQNTTISPNPVLDTPISDTDGPTPYGSPFDDEDADVILRSSNLVDFRTYKVLLKKASPIFADIFSLPQSPTQEGNLSSKDYQDGLPIVCVTEDGPTIEALLAILSHVRMPKPASLEQAAAIIAAAKKYEMDGVVLAARATVTKGMVDADNSLRAFGIAHRLRLRDEALAAARYTLEKPMSIEEYREKLCFVSGTALFQLWEFRQQAVHAIVQHLTDTQAGAVLFFSVFGKKGKCLKGGWSQKAIEGSLAWVPQWWRDYIQRTIDGLQAGTIMPAPEAAVNHWVFYNSLATHQAQVLCPCCNEISAQETHRFCTLLETELANAVEAVCTASQICAE